MNDDDLQCESCQRSISEDEHHSLSGCNGDGVGVTLCPPCCCFADALMARRAAAGGEHPTQPTVLTRGVRRFKANAIVRWLLDAGPFDMNTIAVTPFEVEDRRQFAQLIGYSVSGYEDLSYSTAVEPGEAGR